MSADAFQTFNKVHTHRTILEITVEPQNNSKYSERPLVSSILLILIHGQDDSLQEHC